MLQPNGAIFSVRPVREAKGDLHHFVQNTVDPVPDPHVCCNVRRHCPRTTSTKPGQGPVRPRRFVLMPRDGERATGIEPAFSAWEADVLPLYDARATGLLADHASPNSVRRAIAPGGGRAVLVAGTTPCPPLSVVGRQRKRVVYFSNWNHKTQAKRTATKRPYAHLAKAR